MLLAMGTHLCIAQQQARGGYLFHTIHETSLRFHAVFHELNEPNMNRKTRDQDCSTTTPANTLMCNINIVNYC